MTPYRVVVDLAAEVGFDFCAVVAPNVSLDMAQVRARVKAGHMADMRWFERSLEKRADPRRWMSDVRAIITVGLSYFSENPPANLWNDPRRGRVARYAWGPDYHTVMSAGLQKLADRLQQVTSSHLRWRICVDSGPLFERYHAAAAHPGFLTKNTMFVHSQYGAYILLGELLVSEPLELSPPPALQASAPCEACQSCLAACPTGALIADYTLDARRCIAYQTVENRAPIPADLRPHIGQWIFGCDECLQPCPIAQPRSLTSRKTRWRFDPEISAPALHDVLRWSEADFLERYAGSAVQRTGWRRFLRNALVAAGNSGDKTFADLLAVHARSPDELLSEHAKWGLGRLQQVPASS